MSTSATRELEAAIARKPQPVAGVPLSAVRFMYAEISGEYVTATMFGQLDTVPYDRFSPVARVQPPMAGRYAIGASPDGLLVRASFDAAWPGMPTSSWLRGEEMARLHRMRWRADADPGEVMRLEAIEEQLPDYESALQDHMALPLLLLARLGRKEE